MASMVQIHLPSPLKARSDEVYIPIAWVHFFGGFLTAIFLIILFAAIHNQKKKRENTDKDNEQDEND